MITLNRFLQFCACGLTLVLTAAGQQDADSSPRVEPVFLAQARTALLSVQDVIDLVEAGLSDDLVIAAVRKRSQPFDLATADLLRLKKAGVSEAVIRVMMGSEGSRHDSSTIQNIRAPDTATESELPSSVEPVSSSRIPSQQQALAESFPPSLGVQLELGQEISSATAQPGDEVTFRATDDVEHQGGVLISAGTLARGSVKKAKKKSLLSKGKLELDERVTIRDVHGYELIVTLANTNNRTPITAGAKAVGGAVVAPFKGKKDVVLPAGTLLEGIVTKRTSAGHSEAHQPVAQAPFRESGGGPETSSQTLTSPAPGISSGNRVKPPTVSRRIYIKAKGEVVEGIEIPSKILEDSVRDLKGMARKRGYAVADGEGDAGLMLVVLERKIEEGRPSFLAHKTKRMETVLHTALFYKEAGEWKPGLTLTNRAKYWKDAAWKMIREVDKWVEGKLLRQQKEV